MAVKTDLEISSVKYKDKYGHTTEIPVKSGGGEDMLQARVDETKDCQYLMAYYKGTNPDIIKNLNTTGVTNMSNMFLQNSELDTINLSNLNTSSVTNMSSMFKDTFLKTLDLSGFNTSNVTSFYNLFNDCVNLTNINFGENFKSNNVTNFGYMFYNCKSLTELNLSNLNTSNVTDMSYLFSGCSALVNVIGTIDMIKVTRNTSWLNGCNKLENLILKNIKITLSLSNGVTSGGFGVSLSQETLINTIKELWDYSSGTTTYTLTITNKNLPKIADIYVKLITPTEEQIEADPNIVNKMPCEVCESTDEGAMLITDYATLKKWTIR